MKIVLDTNVLVSALLNSYGVPAQILGFVLNGTIKIVYDNRILEEYKDVLNRKKLNINSELINFIIDFINNEGEYKIAEPQSIKLKDEDDQMFYEVYRSGEIDYLITGNIKDFPKEKNIVTPREYIEL
ncbi:MAG: putative toxin-antitoxin system toxin component, PIN family, partial [Spirochaetales bacterium]|nr:putative toxin-antitoxin system toxin component, PIN family [Spirochaetales bacterium]